MALNIRTVLDFCILFWVFLLATWPSAGPTDFDIRVASKAIVLVAGWCLSTVLTNKFSQTHRPGSLSDALAPFVKGGILMLVTVWIMTLVLGLETGLLVVACVFSLVELLVLGILFLAGVDSKIFARKSLQEHGGSKSRQVDLQLDGVESLQRPNLCSAFAEADFQPPAQLADFVERAIETTVNASAPPAAVSAATGSGNTAALHVCLPRLNDVRQLNKHLLSCYKSVRAGGWLLAQYTPMEELLGSWSQYRSGASLKLATFLHFLFHRVWPRLPRINKLYFMFTRGKNRALSRAETWGRLHYCGFEVLNETRIDGVTWVVARKARTPSCDASPSYYPIVKLDRVGKDGRIVQVYKVRTMHPYSEYIQKKVFERNSLNQKGKFQDDFRRTGWGIFLRKRWLDEIPQLFDWLRGDLKLVGICAMSEHYFSLYSKKYQELFKRVKPGVVPPLMDDTTQGFEQIQEIEQTYLESFLAHPLKTDLTYLWRTFAQICLKGGRSG